MDLNLEQLKAEFSKNFQLEGVPEEKREALMEKLGETLLKHIFVETMEKIGAEGVAEYEQLLEREASEEEIGAFFESRIPGYQVFVREIVEQFQEDMRSRMAELSA